MAYTYKPYQPSDRVKKAQTALDIQQAAKPADYQSRYQDQLDSLLGQIQNRKPFQYDMNADALYNQYKDQYIRNGRLAMQDTMGQAAAMTGGYGNSYAQSVGQQAYQGYLAGLNDRLPELYSLALDQYNREGQDLKEQYALLGDRESQEYSRYQDMLSRYLADRDYLTGRYENERQYDYGMYEADRAFDYNNWVNERDFTYNKEIDERDFEYQKLRDQEADRQWQAEFDYRKYLDDLARAGAAAGGGGGGSRKTTNPYVENSKNIISSGYGKLQTTRYLANAEYEVRNDNSLSPSQKAAEIAKINAAKKEYSLSEKIAHMNDYGT